MWLKFKSWGFTVKNKIDAIISAWTDENDNYWEDENGNVWTN